MVVKANILFLQNFNLYGFYQSIVHLVHLMHASSMQPEGVASKMHKMQPPAFPMLSPERKAQESTGKHKMYAWNARVSRDF